MEKVYSRLEPKIGHMQNEWYNLTDACFFCHNGALKVGLKEFDIHLITDLVHIEYANAGEVLTVKLVELMPNNTFIALEAKIVKVCFHDWSWTILDIYYDQNPKDEITVKFEVSEINY